MEPPGTAVRTAVSPGHARPSGPKLSVLLSRSYAFTISVVLGKTATPRWCVPVVQVPGRARCSCRVRQRSHCREHPVGGRWPVMETAVVYSDADAAAPYDLLN